MHTPGYVGAPMSSHETIHSMTTYPATSSWLMAACLGLSLTIPVSAELQWYGDPAKGREVFNNLNFEGAERFSPGTGTILPATDPLHGKIWRIHKPAPDKRAEIRGAAGWSYHTGKGGVMKQGETYYLGWRYKFEMPDKKTKGWACFQWKTYAKPDKPDENTQEYPLLMGYDGRALTLTKYGAGWKTNRTRITKLWSHPVKIGEWVDIVLVIKQSINDKEGYVELHFNGDLQQLLTGATRDYHKTMDGWEVAPKWGAYNRNAIGTDIIVSLADLRIGTSLESVMPKPVIATAPAGITLPVINKIPAKQNEEKKPQPQP